MYLVTISIAIWLTVACSTTEILDNRNNELTLGGASRKFSGLVVPVRIRRQNEGQAKHELEEDKEIDTIKPPKVFDSEESPKQEDQFNLNVDDVQPSVQVQEKLKKRSPVAGAVAGCYDCAAGGGVVPVGGVATAEERGRAGSWSQSSSSSSSGGYSNDYNGMTKRGLGKK